MARRTAQTTEQLQSAVAEIKTVATKKSARGTTTPEPAQTGLTEAAGAVSGDDSKVNTLVAKLRAMVAKAEQSAREESELFSDDESEHDLAEQSARAEQLRKLRKQLKAESTDPIVKKAISKYLETLKPTDQLSGTRGRKASFKTKVGQSGSVQITGPYAGLAGWTAGTVLSIVIDGDKLTLTPIPAES